MVGNVQFKVTIEFDLACSGGCKYNSNCNKQCYKLAIQPSWAEMIEWNVMSNGEPQNSRFVWKPIESNCTRSQTDFVTSNWILPTTRCLLNSSRQIFRSYDWWDSAGDSTTESSVSYYKLRVETSCNQQVSLRVAQHSVGNLLPLPTGPPITIRAG